LNNLGKIPFCFPVVYHGLIAGHSRHNQEDSFNIIIFGDSMYPYGHIDKSQAGAAIRGKIDARPAWKDDYFAASEDERIGHLKKLELSNPEVLVSAFHAYIRSDDCDITVQPWQLEQLELVASFNDDPYTYIQKAIEIAFRYEDRDWVDVNYKVDLIKDKLHTLSAQIPFDNLYLLPQLDRYLTVQRSADMLASAVVPRVVQTVLAALIPQIREIPDALEQIQNGDFYGLVNSIASANAMSYWERWKWLTRRLPIAEMANDFLHSSNCSRNDSRASSDYENTDDEPRVSANFDIDWFIEFFEYAGNISDEHMKELWAKVLAGKISNPTSTSKRILRTMMELSEKEVIIFEHLSGFVLYDCLEQSALPFISFECVFPLDWEKLFREECRILVSCGLLFPSETHNLFNDDRYRIAVFTNENAGAILRFEMIDGRDTCNVSHERYYLTDEAIELLPFARQLIMDDSLLLAGRLFKEKTKAGFKVGLYKTTINIHKGGNKINSYIGLFRYKQTFDSINYLESDKLEDDFLFDRSRIRKPKSQNDFSKEECDEFRQTWHEIERINTDTLF